jgi:methionyl-tRNA formyltransferase
LRRWRGAAPIQRAIEAGDERTGVTIMQMDIGLDTGAMLLKRETEISETDTAATVHDRLARLGAEAMVETLRLLENGALAAEPQDPALASYARKLDKAEAEINWDEAAELIARRIRAFHPWPGSVTRWQGKRLRLVTAAALRQDTQAEPGTVVGAQPEGIDIATGAGVLRVTTLQAEGGKPLGAAAFLNGHALAAGERLGR